MSDETERYERAGFTVRIEQDEAAETPEWGDTPVYLAHFHRNFEHCGDALPFSTGEGMSEFLREPVRDDYDDEDDYREALSDYRANTSDQWAIFRVSSYIHSGVVLALAGSIKDANFPDRQWDVSHCGVVMIKKDGEWGKTFQPSARKDSNGTDMEMYRGQYPHSTRALTTKEADLKETGPMFRLTFEDGQEIDAFEDELTVDYEKMAESHIETWNQYLSCDVYGYIIEDEDGEELESCWGMYGFDYCKEEANDMADFCRRHADKEAAEFAAEFAAYCDRLDPLLVTEHIKRQKLAEAAALTKAPFHDRVNYLLTTYSREELVAMSNVEDVL